MFIVMGPNGALFLIQWHIANQFPRYPVDLGFLSNLLPDTPRRVIERNSPMTEAWPRSDFHRWVDMLFHGG
jgi:hypothetical protein